MKANTNANIGNTYIAPAAQGREARLDQVASSLEEQSLQVQSLSGEQLADYRAYGAGMEADMNTVQGYGPQGQGYDPVGAIDQILAQLQQQQNYHMQMMMLQYIMAMLQMMMEMMGQQGQGQGGPQDGGPGPDAIDETGGPDQTDGPKEADKDKKDEDAMTPMRAARILAKYFDLLDTAAGKGKKDNVVELADLAAVAQNPDLPEELRLAADYVVKNPAVANALDVGNKTDEVDGKFGLKDFESFIKEHEGKEGYDKPVPDKKPVDKSDEKKPVDDKEKKPVDEADEKPVDDKDKKPVDETDKKPVDEKDKKPVDEVDLPNPNPNPQDAIKAQQDATALFEAMDGMGTDEAVLIRILSNQTNKQIATLKDAYSKTYSRDLVEHVKSETSGHLQDVLLGLLKGSRDESTKVDPNLVQNDAQALANAGGPGGFFTDDEKLVSIFTTRSKAHLAEVAKVFEHINGKSLRSFIEQQTSGDYEKSLLAQLP